MKIKDLKLVQYQEAYNTFINKHGIQNKHITYWLECGVDIIVIGYLSKVAINKIKCAIRRTVWEHVISNSELRHKYEELGVAFEGHKRTNNHLCEKIRIRETRIDELQDLIRDNKSKSREALYEVESDRNRLMATLEEVRVSLANSKLTVLNHSNTINDLKKKAGHKEAEEVELRSIIDMQERKLSDMRTVLSSTTTSLNLMASK